MIEFAKQITEKWNISPAVSEAICNAFQKGDTPYYLAEYHPETAVEISISYLWEIFDFLHAMEELASKKKRILNALKKAEKLTPAIEKRVNLTGSSFDLDDMLLPLRPNPRSRGQLAIKKGLEPLADIVARQEEQDVSIEELAARYSAADPSLGSVSDIMLGIKDVLAERFAYDDTVRAMAREFAYEDGYFEVTPKNKQDKRFAGYAGKQIPLSELSKEEILTLLTGEDEKAARCKLSVQLFRITEVLRHHFIQNPDFSGFDFLCEIIDESWQRLLQAIIERDVKIRLREEAEEWALKKIAPDLEKKNADDQKRGTLLIVDASHPKFMFFLIVTGHGELLGSTSEKRPADGKTPSLERLRQFYLRYRPASIVLCEHAQAEVAKTFIAQITAGDEAPPPVTIYHPDETARDPSESDWVKKKYELLLDNNTRKVYGAALMYLQPLRLLPNIGVDYYTVHPLQRLVSKDRFVTIVNRIVTDASLHEGILLKDIAESRLGVMQGITPEILQAIRAAEIKDPFNSKNGLLQVPGMTEVIFRNVAGFIIIAQSDDFRDRSLVHPDHYPLLDDACDQLNASLDTIMNEPEILRSYVTEDYVKKIFIEKKLIPQVRECLRTPALASLKAKRKLRLTDLKEGNIISGRVTNITPFGVFVNINAVCDGLIHISQLADDYVETPEQVVAVHDRVDVRILKVDVKKRRISLSMKNLGKKGPRIKPTQGQINTLAEHFKNR